MFQAEIDLEMLFQHQMFPTEPDQIPPHLIMLSPKSREIYTPDQDCRKIQYLI